MSSRVDTDLRAEAVKRARAALRPLNHPGINFWLERLDGGAPEATGLWHPDPPRWLTRAPGRSALISYYQSELVREQVCRRSNRYQAAITQLTPPSGIARPDFARSLRLSVEPYLRLEAAVAVSELAAVAAAIPLVPVALAVALAMSSGDGAWYARALIAVVAAVLIGMCARRLIPRAVERRSSRVLGVAVIGILCFTAIGSTLALAGGLVRSPVLAGLFVAGFTWSAPAIALLGSMALAHRYVSHWRRRHADSVAMSVALLVLHYVRSHARTWGTPDVKALLSSRLTILAGVVEKLSTRSADRTSSRDELRHTANAIRARGALVGDPADRMAVGQYITEAIRRLYRGEWSGFAGD